MRHLICFVFVWTIKSPTKDRVPAMLEQNNLPEPTVSVQTEIQQEPNNSKKIWITATGLGFVLLIALLIGYHFYSGFEFSNQLSFLNVLFDSSFFTFVLVGFIAQMIDGALGMAYGISSTTMMMSAGVPPAAASAGVHAAEVFTSGASGLSHLFVGNVNKKLVKRLIIPGVIGAVLGAFCLTQIETILTGIVNGVGGLFGYSTTVSISGDAIKPIVSAYLLIMGGVVLSKAFKKKKKKKKIKKLAPLAFFGGFMDSIGGGGWGPIVSSHLIGKGRSPKYTIGSVNLAEFFVAFASAGVFTIMLGFQNWIIVLGLIVGGVMAAPLAAIVVGKIKTKPLMIMVGCLIILLSLRTIIKAMNDANIIHLW